jgi:hypothetical protein
MSMLDDEEPGTCPKYVSRVSTEPAKIWDAAQITTFPDGNWIVFLDNARAGLNSPRPRHGGSKIPYHYKGYHPHEPPPPPDALSVPKNDNYTAVRARRRIYGANQVQSARQAQSARGGPLDQVEVYSPDAVHRQYFRGADPSKNPFRKSVKLVNEQRAQETTTRPPRVQKQIVKASRPSLFKRSLTIKKQKSVLSLIEQDARDTDQ